jgi:hypothetical protein
MRKLKFFAILLIFASCRNAASSRTDFPADSEIPEDLTITLERTGCYATVNVCPTYKLTVKADGAVVFEGKDVTEVKGEIEDKISVEKVKRLVAEFRKADYFNLENSYDYENCPSTHTDRPNANTSIEIEGKQKTIYHYLGCKGKDSEIFPARLSELENKIDEIVETKRWIGEQK